MMACVLVAVSATFVAGARIRPGGDPRPDRVIWADPFDNYSQWAWDNQDNPAYQPNGTLWDGGPMPAGSISGIYPYKSDNGSASPYNGCGVTRQTSPAYYYLAKQQWVSNVCDEPIITPAGYPVGISTFYSGPDDFVPNTNCTSGGWVETISMFGRVDSVWQAAAQYYTSLGIFTHDLVSRIQSWSPLRAWDEANPNAVQGTDEHPLTFIFYLSDTGNPNNPRAFVNNSYLELNLDDEHAPTDYIWRGDRNMPYPGPECCPEGPYPIICQQVRELNEGNYEKPVDVQYLNDHCPSLVPPFDPQTGTGKTWSAIAFGFLAIACKDPCTCEEQGVASHRPTMNHPMLFNGNVWRELRNGRGGGLMTCPPTWGTPDPEWGYQLAGPETTMQDAGGGSAGNFSLGGGTHRVYLKLTTNRILIWMHNNVGDFCGSYDRVYKGPFNRISWGVGPGCELKDKTVDGDEYACKPDGTPTQCLTYSNTTKDGFWRNECDAMVLLDGALVQNTSQGACCKPDGECIITTQADCTLLDGVFHGANTVCESFLCCPRPFADTDVDGDVDQTDFGAFQICYTGDNGGVIPSCECLNRNGDSDVDTLDFAAFGDCWTGANVPWSQGLTPDCEP